MRFIPVFVTSLITLTVISSFASHSTAPSHFTDEMPLDQIVPLDEIVKNHNSQLYADDVTHVDLRIEPLALSARERDRIAKSGSPAPQQLEMLIDVTVEESGSKYVLWPKWAARGAAGDIMKAICESMSLHAHKMKSKITKFEYDPSMNYFRTLGRWHTSLESTAECR